MRALEPLVAGHVVAPLGEHVGQVLLVHVGRLVVVRVAVADADAVRPHPAHRRVAQVHRAPAASRARRTSAMAAQYARPARFDLGAAAR